MIEPALAAKGGAEVRVDVALPADGASLQALQRRCTHSATFDVEKYNHPDFFGRSRVYESARVFTARLGDEIVGSQAGGIRQVIVAGVPRTVGYMFQLFVAPEAQGRGIAGKLRKACLAYFAEQGCHLTYTIVADGNTRSSRFAAKAGDRPTRALTMASLPVYRAMATRSTAGVTIRPFVATDADEVAALAQRTWAGHEMYEPRSGAELLRDLERVPGCGADSLLVLEEQGRIRACAGAWNSSEIERVTIRSLSMRLRATAWALDTVRLMRNAPRVPRPGETLRHWVLKPLGWERVDQLGALFRAVNDRALTDGIGQLFLLSEAKHPMLQALDGFFQVEMGLGWFMLPIAAGAQLGDGPLYVNPTDQ
jgi:ribosomal protein S18 acetylase RimI-like enzyme